MANQTVTETFPYLISADMLGPEFCGHEKDLEAFVSILARVTGRPESDFVVRQHVAPHADAEEPSESEWNSALDEFVSARPDLFGEAAL